MDNPFHPQEPDTELQYPYAPATCHRGLLCPRDEGKRPLLRQEASRQGFRQFVKVSGNHMCEPRHAFLLAILCADKMQRMEKSCF